MFGVCQIYILKLSIIIGIGKVSESEFKPVHVNISKYGENQRRNGNLRAKDSQSNAAGESAFLHGAGQDEMIYLFLRHMKIESDSSGDKVE